jgi:hypothetical protein
MFTAVAVPASPTPFGLRAEARSAKVGARRLDKPESE